MLKYEVRFHIAGLNFQVKSNKAEPINWLKERYAMYLVNSEPDTKVKLYYYTDNPCLSRDRVFTKPYNIYGKIGKKCEFKIYTKKGYLGIGSLLRLLSSVLFIRKGGFLLHSCGIIIDGSVHLLAGPSGAGKTTVARLVNNEYVLLSDETVAVIKKDRRYYAWATPFFGDFNKITSNTGAILKNILLLKQSDHFAHKRLSAYSAMTRILQNIFLSKTDLTDKYGMNKIMDNAFELAQKVPCYELEFLPDNRIWKYIEKKISLGV